MLGKKVIVLSYEEDDHFLVGKVGVVIDTCSNTFKNLEEEYVLVEFSEDIKNGFPYLHNNGLFGGNGIRSKGSRGWVFNKREVQLINTEVSLKDPEFEKMFV